MVDVVDRVDVVDVVDVVGCTKHMYCDCEMLIFSCKPNRNGWTTQQTARQPDNLRQTKSGPI